jgi:hypothetical protein
VRIRITMPRPFGQGEAVDDDAFRQLTEHVQLDPEPFSCTRHDRSVVFSFAAAGPTYDRPRGHLSTRAVTEPDATMSCNLSDRCLQWEGRCQATHATFAASGCVR